MWYIVFECTVWRWIQRVDWCCVTHCMALGADVCQQPCSKAKWLISHNRGYSLTDTPDRLHCFDRNSLLTIYLHLPERGECWNQPSHLNVCIVSSFVSICDCHINGKGTGDIDHIHTAQASIPWLFCLLICTLEEDNAEIITSADLWFKKKKFSNTGSENPHDGFVALFVRGNKLPRWC